MTPAPAKICDFIDCRMPVYAKSLCSRHYNQNREPRKRPTRPKKVLELRARRVATQQLIDAHREEFDQFYGAALLEVVKENNEVLQTLGMGQPIPEPANAEEPVEIPAVPDVVPLRSGRRGQDHKPIDRVLVEIEKLCVMCGNYHERGHRCPACSVMTRPDHKKISSDGSTSTRIRNLLVAGKSAQWLIGNGENREQVYAVLRELNKETVAHKEVHQ